MKQRSFLIFVAFIMLFALVMPQNMTAKKIMYKHHQYKGDVSKEQIPQGKGEIDIAGIVIKGIFDATNITNAYFERDWLKYEGDVTFSESKSVTLKTGGKFTRYYYEENSIRIYPHNASTTYVYPNELANNKKSITEILSEDIEIDNDGLLKDVVKIPIKTEMKGVPLELYPPVVTLDIPIPLFKFTKWVDKIQNNENNGGDIYLHVVPSQILSREIPVKDYKDDEGRVWNYMIDPRGYSNNVTYKVTYPDGSYSSNETGGKIVKP